MGAGECSAVIAEVAEEPEPAEAMDCGRALVMPETGSVLVAGHSPLGAFFRVVLSRRGSDPVPFACEDAETVELVEACEDKEEDELERWVLFRGMNIGRNSSVGPFAALPVHLF